MRYSGTFGNAEITTGVYYFEQDIAYTEVRDLPPLSAATFYGGGAQNHTVFGLFGAVDLAITDKLSAQFGIRYSEEDKSAEITYIRPRPQCSVVSGTCPITGTNPFVPGENNGFSDSDSWNNWSPKVGLQYFVKDDTQLYTSWSRGYRSGGYNFRITAPAAFEAIFPPGSPRAFDEEKVDSFEAGVKFNTEDRRLQLNGAAFLTDISDMQRELNLSDPTAGVLQTIINTADATIKGVELEGKFRATDNLLLTGNIGLIDADYDSVLFDISSDGLVNDADLALAIPRVPSATYGVGFIHDMNLGNSGSVTSRANYQHRNRFAYTDNNFGFVQAADQVDANITWNTPMDGVSLALYAKNLLDEVQVGGDTQLPFGGPQSPAIPGSQNLANGVNAPFDNNPAVGTFSPLKKGRLIGIELTIRG